MRSLLLVFLVACTAEKGGSAQYRPDAGVDPMADAAPGEPDAGVDAAPPAKTPKVLLVGIDGVRFDKLAELELPALEGLAARGLSSRTWIYAGPMAPTVSGPGWATNLTGVWPDRHRVLDNNLGGHDLAGYPDVLTRVEQAAPALFTSAIAGWPQLTGDGGIVAPGLDERLLYNGYTDPGGWDAADEKVTVAAIDTLVTADPDLLFVYLGNPDEVGHARGVGAEYLAAIVDADERLGRLITAVESRATHAQEDWLILVTTDHGHVDGGGHGGFSWQERQSFVFAAGGGMPVGVPAIQPRNVDLVPTILAHLDAVVEPLRLDGRVLGSFEGDAFDSVLDALEPAADETVDVLGWTHTPPQGWGIDNSRMAPGGTVEWRGWSFVDEQFWTQAAPGQSREAFVRSRGVIAVADPDEWDDVGSPSSTGRFDSTLLSPAYPVRGGGSYVVTFASFYLQEGTQKAEVKALFDDGSQRELLRYGSVATDDNFGGDVISKIERIPLTVPAGASTVRIAFRLHDAGNNWYWAIDDPRIE